MDDMQATPSVAGTDSNVLSLAQQLAEWSFIDSHTMDIVELESNVRPQCAEMIHC